MATYPLRFSNCLNSPWVIEKFLSPSHYMESRVGLGVVCWCANWLTSRCPKLPGNRELVSSKSPTWKMKCEPEQEDHDKNVSLGVFLLNLILPTILRGLNSTGFLLSLPLKPRFPVCVCACICACKCLRVCSLLGSSVHRIL